MFDREKLDIRCPNGHPVAVAIREARRSPTVKCSRCGAAIEIDARDLDRKLRRVERQLKDFGKRFGR